MAGNDCNLFTRQISELERPLDVPDHGLICDLLWSDPDEVFIFNYPQFQ